MWVTLEGVRYPVGGSKPRYDEISDLVSLTKITHSVIREDVKRMIRLMVNSVSVPYARRRVFKFTAPPNRNGSGQICLTTS
jgi:hypothetical protein